MLIKVKKSINVFQYYKEFIEENKIKRERARITVDELTATIASKRSAIVPDVDKFKYPVIDYPEFQQNKYINGRLENAAKGMFEDERRNPEMKHLCFRLVGYAVDLRKIYEETEKISFYDKLINLSLKEYRRIVKIYYNAVERELILKGHGYRLEDKLGWICINRVINTIGSKVCDFAATRKNKERLIAEGKQIYNKDEAEYCRNHGIEYNAVNATVYKSDEVWYEYCLLGSKVQGRALCFKTVDSKGMKLRQYSHEELLKLTNNDVNKIMDLDISLRYKFVLCIQADKTLYTKFIRNEEQNKSLYGTYRRKSRERLQSKRK